jgi:hypothetical protein
MHTAIAPNWLEVLAEQGLSGADPRPYMPGIRTEGDVLVDRSADGIDLNVIYREITDVLAAWNSERLALASLLAYPTTVVGDAVPQNISSESFEEAEETTIPKAMGQDGALLMGYKFRDYDLRSAYTWRFLRDSTAEQIQNQFVRGIEADAKLISGLILDRVFDPSEDINEHGHRVFGLWNGTDGLNPPAYLGRTFPASTSHYWATQAAQLDSQDVEWAIDAIRAKGYGRQLGSQILILANPAEGEQIAAWRAGKESRPSGPVARHDFIPSSNAPARLEAANIVGQVAPADLSGLKVEGSYGPALLIESDFIPSGYVAVVASAGPGSVENVVALREHVNESYRGLRLIPGNWQSYPMIDSFLVRSAGVGVRHRGAAVCLQVTTSSTYTPPAIPR